MQVLILGGTRFVGRHIVEAFLAGGHRVTILTRGRTPDELPAGVERLRGDRDMGAKGVAALADRFWDACVDVCGYTPRQVRAIAELLSASVNHYVFISAVKVYGDPDKRPVRETHPLLPPAGEDVTEIDNQTYGPLKVACETFVQDAFGDRCAILRPQVVAGPCDPSGRYTYWVNCAGRGGEILAPGDGLDHVQVIDARDLAGFVVKLTAAGMGGVFNVAGPRITWAEFMRALGAKQPVWASTEILQSAGVSLRELPLFRPEGAGTSSGTEAVNGFSSLMDISSELARSAGLTLTDPATTVRDTRAWSLGVDTPEALSPEREAEIIRLAKERHVGCL